MTDLEMTPRTDAFDKGYESGDDWAEYRRAINFARELERELAAMQERFDDLQNHYSNELTKMQRDTTRYRWWRENIDCIAEDGDGIAGVAYSFQIPMHGLCKGVPEQTSAELMDAIADAAIRSSGESTTR